MITSPALQTYIKNQTNLNTNIQEPVANLSLKPDTVEINKKANKKIGKYVAIGLAAAATVAGVVFLVTKGKTCLLELNAKKAQKLADDIQARAEKLKEEVVELFNNNGIKQGNKVAEIITQEDGSELMQELASDGSVLRESIFIDKILDRIEVPAKKGEDVYNFLQDGKLSRYTKGYENFADGSWKFAKDLTFEDGKLSEYRKGYEEFADGSFKIAKDLTFEDGKLSEYRKGHENFTDGSWKYAKNLTFEDGKLSEYRKGYEVFADGSRKAAKSLEFEDGKLRCYGKGHEQFADGSCKAAKYLVFEDGKLIVYVKGFEQFEDGSCKAAKLSCYLKGFEQFEDGSCKAAKSLEF